MVCTLPTPRLPVFMASIMARRPVSLAFMVIMAISTVGTRLSTTRCLTTVVYLK